MNIDNLNKQQKEAVELVGGPILIFAGAGSGKTRVLTHKIAYLVQEIGLPPENILAVTFTNKAADEMKQRVQKLLNMDVSSMSVGTFHSISARILRREIHALGYDNNFVIYDQDDSKALIKGVIRDMELDEKTFVPKSIQGHVSKYKNQMVDYEYLNKTATGYFDEKLSEIYMHYQRALQGNNALDFDDLLLKPLELFSEHPSRLEFYQEKFKYVLVDEYQDTNRPQFEFVHALSSKHRDICVVGDDDQSIYSWRGADVNNILNFSESFGDSNVIKLEQNYRSTQFILDCAWSVVSRNSSRAEKKLWTENEKGEKLSIIECRDERDESWKIIKIIRNESLNSNRSFDQIVILYRTNAQSRAIEDALRREAVPYQIIGGTKFYERKEIKDVLAYLRLIVNPNDGISFDRIINFPARGIGKTSVEKIHSLAKEKDCSYLNVISNPEGLDVGQKQKKSLKEFSDLILKFKNSYEKLDAATITTDLLLDINLKNYYENQNTVEAQDRWSNVEELLNSIVDFQDLKADNNLSDFLEEVSLLTDIDRWNEADKAVTLMTIHSAKGLEFPVVIMAGLEEGLFPLGGSSYELEDLEEERRLFYVALTRAEKKVYLSHANARRRFGGPPMPTIQSRFLHELPLEMLDQVENNQVNKIKSSFNEEKISIVPKIKSTANEFSIGDQIEHKLFGRGKILAIEGNGSAAKLTIQFSGNIRKKLIAKYANLTQLKT
tara:strand:+ start:1405 stop:3570 length:2166 start_codon:yes stop_codon:yes gene_type:complete